MRIPSRRWRTALLLSLLLPAALPAQEIPLTNWTVPPYRGAGSSGGLTTMTDISPGIGFVAIQPCRVVDTRGGGVFTGTYGPPIMAAGATRDFDINSAPHCPGIPALADAYSLNFTVTQTAGAPGDIRAWPQGNPPVQITSVLNWTVPGATVANATIMPAGTGGGITVEVAGTNTHLLIDINGYFTDVYNAGVPFSVVADVASSAAIGGSNSSSAGLSTGVTGLATGASQVFGVRGIVGASATGGSAGVFGQNLSSNAGVNGVWGSVLGGSGSNGVLGTNANTGADGAGVTGTHAGAGVGVYGTATGTSGSSSRGVQGFSSSTSDGATGVYGGAAGATGATSGVWGVTNSAAIGAAGVRGRDGTGALTNVGTCCFSAGVRGEARNGNGVLGLSEGIGSIGVLRSAAGANLAIGYLGSIVMGSNYGVYSNGNAHVAGTFTATNKLFVQPHPSDPSKEIRYVSLEGPHSEVYFRGTAQISQGITKIPIPEDFRFVAASDSYSTLVTPVGEMATVAVLSEGEDGIVVQASRNVKIHYVVYAEREAVRNPDPIVENIHFRPEPDDEMLAHVPDSYRQLMIQNGTLNPDGTVNLETARRLGWDTAWKSQRTLSPESARQ